MTVMDASLMTSFVDAATRAVTELAATQEPFTTDEVWAKIGSPSEWMVEPRALGSVIRQASVTGVVRSTGQKQTSKRRECHGRPVTVWVGTGVVHEPAPVKTRRSRRRKRVVARTPSLQDPVWLHARYVLDGMPVAVVARETGRRPSEVLTALADAGIVVRRGAEDSLTVPVLASLFVEKGFDTWETGQITGTGAGTVEVMLDRFGIKASDRGTGRQAAQRLVAQWRADQPPLVKQTTVPAERRGTD